MLCCAKRLFHFEGGPIFPRFFILLFIFYFIHTYIHIYFRKFAQVVLSNISGVLQYIQGLLHFWMGNNGTRGTFEMFRQRMFQLSPPHHVSSNGHSSRKQREGKISTFPIKCWRREIRPEKKWLRWGACPWHAFHTKEEGSCGREEELHFLVEELRKNYFETSPGSSEFARISSEKTEQQLPGGYNPRAMSDCSAGWLTADVVVAGDGIPTVIGRCISS